MDSVSPYTTTLCQQNAYWMARLALEVYTSVSPADPTPHAEQILSNIQANDPAFLSVKGFNRDNAQAAVVEHQQYLCIVFRGTDEIEDWLDNINAFSVQEIFGEFHRGFFNSVNAIWQQIEQHIAQLMHLSKKPLFISGHSLGGAMATIAAAKLVHQDKPFTSVYTFGQPRVVRRATSRILNSECKDRYFRFHNNNDIVTRVPTRMMGYSHVGSYLYITEEGEIHQDVGKWFRFLDYVDGAIESIKDKKLLDVIHDHGMDDYLAHISRWQLR